MDDELKDKLQKMTDVLEQIKDMIQKMQPTAPPPEPWQYPSKPWNNPPYKHPYPYDGGNVSGCYQCGLKFDGPMGYVCPRSDCPSKVSCSYTSVDNW